MARDGKPKIDFEQTPLIVDMHQKRRERFKWKKTPDPVLSKPRVATHQPGVDVATASAASAVESAQQVLRSAEKSLSIWWPSPTQLKHIEANWAFFLGFILMSAASGIMMSRQIAGAVYRPLEDIGQLIAIPLGATVYFLILSFIAVRLLRFFGGPITTLAQLGRFSTLSNSVRTGMGVGVLVSLFTPNLFGFDGSIFWTIFSTLGTAGLFGSIFAWIDRNLLGGGQTISLSDTAPRDLRDDQSSVFDTVFYRETLPILAALIVTAGAVSILIADHNAGRNFSNDQISIGNVSIDRSFVLLPLQAAILVFVFRWTARIVSALKYFFGFKDPEELT